MSRSPNKSFLHECIDKLRAYLAVCGGVLLMLSIGSTFAFGNIIAYLSSYMTYIHFDKDPHSYPDDEVADKYTDFNNKLVWVYTAAISLLALSSPFGGKLELRFGPRIASFIGLCFAVGSTFLTYYTCDNFVYTFISLGILFGISNGLTFTPPVVCALRWWPHHRAVASSLVTLGYSCSTVWVDYVETLYLNPNGNGSNDISKYGYVYHSGIMQRFPNIFLILGCVYLVLMSIGIIFLSNPDEKGYGIETNIIDVTDVQSKKDIKQKIIDFEKNKKHSDSNSKSKSNSNSNSSVNDHNNKQQNIQNNMDNDIHDQLQGTNRQESNIHVINRGDRAVIPSLAPLIEANSERSFGFSSGTNPNNYNCNYNYNVSNPQSKGASGGSVTGGSTSASGNNGSINTGSIFDAISDLNSEYLTRSQANLLVKDNLSGYALLPPQSVVSSHDQTIDSADSGDELDNNNNNSDDDEKRNLDLEQMRIIATASAAGLGMAIPYLPMITAEENLKESINSLGSNLTDTFPIDGQARNSSMIGASGGKISENESDLTMAKSLPMVTEVEQQTEIDQHVVADENDNVARKCSSYSDAELNATYSMSVTMSETVADSNLSDADGGGIAATSDNKKDKLKRKKKKRRRRKTSIIHIPTSKRELIVFMEDNISQFAWSYSDALRSARFYHIFFIDFFNTIVITFIISEWKLFGTQYLDITNDEFLTLLGSFASFFSGVGRIAFALFFDWNKSFRITMGTVTLVMCIFICSICIANDAIWKDNQLQSKAIFFVWICVLSLCNGGGYALYASAISHTFGIKNSGMILGTLFCAEVPASIGASFLFDNINGFIGGWLHLSIILGIASGMSCLLALTFSTHNKKKVEFLKENKAWHLIKQKEK